MECERRAKNTGCLNGATAREPWRVPTSDDIIVGTADNMLPYLAEQLAPCKGTVSVADFFDAYQTVAREGVARCQAFRARPVRTRSSSRTCKPAQKGNGCSAMIAHKNTSLLPGSGE